MNKAGRHIVELFAERWDPRGYGVTIKPCMHMSCRPVDRREGERNVVIPFKLGCGQRERKLSNNTLELIDINMCPFFGCMVLIWG